MGQHIDEHAERKHVLFRKSTAILVSLLALMTALPASAQDSPDDYIKLLPGIESAYARRYISAQPAEEFGFATPEASPATGPTRPGTENLPPAGTATVTATVLEFDSATTLTTVWATNLDDELLGEIAGSHGSELEITQVDDLGDLAISAAGVEHDGRSSVVLVVQDGNLGIILTGYGTDEPNVSKSLNAIAEFMVAAEPGTDPVTLDPPSGGTWDIFPTAQDTDVLGNLMPMYDYDLLNGDGSPIGREPATPVG
jgi:hypothetical protein